MPYIAFVVFTGVVLFPFRKKLGRVFFAALLRTPISIVLVTKGGVLEEKPSFLRVLIGLWVMAGMVIVTAYQINVYVVNNNLLLSAVQPGTTYDNGMATSETLAPLSLSVLLYETQATIASSLSLSQPWILPRHSSLGPQSASVTLSTPT